MQEYQLSPVYPNDLNSQRQITNLLETAGLHKDKNLDYTCAIYNQNGRIIATGSCFQNTLRCIAVDHYYQGEGLLGKIITHLTQIQFQRGNSHFFLYSKCVAAETFEHLGFYKIVRANDQIFMENRKNGFHNYCNELSKSFHLSSQAAAIVMNANPFTYGHLYLLERASAENEQVHLFLISEDISLIPFIIRKKLLLDSITHLKNILFHETGPYLISNATFPSYFQKDETDVIKGHALLDTAIFVQIAHALNIHRRYLGEEPTSTVTGIYNQILQQKLPKKGIECKIIPRKEHEGIPISASIVRQMIKKEDFNNLEYMLPKASLEYFLSERAKPVIAQLKQSESVIHY